MNLLFQRLFLWFAPSRTVIFVVMVNLIPAGMLFGQDTLVKDGFQRFFYVNGKMSSEGTIRDGKPDGYWKSYHENGIIKSEGNRLDHELDSLWKFYDQDGKLILEINYKKGKKEGMKTTYTGEEIIKEPFINDFRDGIARYYHPDGVLKQEVPFVRGQEQGFGREYDRQGTIITLTEYKKGFITDRIRINRRDGNGRKQGRWFTFHSNGHIKTEVPYRDDLMHGYFKEYADNGDLVRIMKYELGVAQNEAREVARPDIRKEYYSNGRVKVSAMYRNGLPDGIMQEYDTAGSVVRSVVYTLGKKSGEGLIREDGSHHGPWKDYYHDGSLKAEGNYTQGKKTGDWVFYYPGGKLEQKGRYNKDGKPHGMWRWYYENGQLWREESYRSGSKDGLSVTYDETGRVIESGDFLDGEEDGPWFELIGDTYTRGEYRDGRRTGIWTSYFLNISEGRTDSICFFRGRFVDDNPDGKHVYYYENGRERMKGSYSAGRRDGEWYYFNEDGTLFLVITCRAGAEIKYDGTKIKPPFEEP